MKMNWKQRVKLHPPRRRLVVAAGALVVLVAVTVTFVLQTYVMQRTEALATELVDQAEAAFLDVELLTPTDLQALRTYRNKAHVAKAESLGVAGIESRDTVETLVEEEKLVPLDGAAYYRVEPMDYGVPFVTPHMANLLVRIGQRFQEKLRAEGLPPYRFVVTSATRTREDQRALQGVNINAATKSSHEFGTTVDVHYERFDYAAAKDSLPEVSGISQGFLEAQVAKGYERLARAYPSRLKAILGEVLLEMQQEGQVLVIHERKQPVYHLTVADAVGPPVASDLLTRRLPPLDDRHF